MRLTGHDVAGPRLDVAEQRHRLDPPFDPLAGPEEPPGQDDGAAGRVAGRHLGGEVRRRPVRDHAHPLRLDHVHLEEPDAGRSALDNDTVGQLRKLLDDRALARRGPKRNRVQHDDHGDAQVRDEIDDLGAALRDVSFKDYCESYTLRRAAELKARHA